jgi:hypothetical protein
MPNADAKETVRTNREFVHGTRARASRFSKQEMRAPSDGDRGNNRMGVAEPASRIWAYLDVLDPRNLVHGAKTPGGRVLAESGAVDAGV